MSITKDLEFSVLTKRYNKTLAVNKISLKIPGGTYCCLLGPSGCGKTSTLRMIAGHEEISEGNILLGNNIINELSYIFNCFKLSRRRFNCSSKYLISPSY